ncbi:MAG: HigA family addiction module antitoxin [Pseudomonadota bacterium]
MSKSSTITDPEWLHNAHAGEILLSEFMQPLNMTSKDLAASLAVDSACLDAVISGEKPVSAELDLRLGRFFQMSEGFFLRLQDSYELLEAKRTLNGALDRITPHAA